MSHPGRCLAGLTCRVRGLPHRRAGEAEGQRPAARDQVLHARSVLPGLVWARGPEGLSRPYAFYQAGRLAMVRDRTADSTGVDVATEPAGCWVRHTVSM